MADRCDRFIGRKEFTHDLQHAGVQPDVFRSTSSGDEETLIVFCLNRVKICCEGKIVTPQFRISLLSEEIMDSSRDSFSCLLIRADCIDLIAQDPKGLERNHCLVIFSKIAAQE